MLKCGKYKVFSKVALLLPYSTWSKCRAFWTKIFIFIVTKTAIFQEWIDCDIISCKFSSEGYLVLMNDDAVISTILMTNHISTCHSMWTNRITTIEHLKFHDSISTPSVARNWLILGPIFWSQLSLFEHRVQSSSRWNDYVQHYIIYCLYSE